ncbi:hypothetical protein DPMN_085023 [Dreissena polymorpha]|uniref:Uncharacterized protein n=1 Tax=Dreissena polymorpha TaxID=45954 RepID=A0A9D4BCI0_DREPO|nr:hypothetical protein DPMN_085023 [Dreissena polymorpha]
MLDHYIDFRILKDDTPYVAMYPPAVPPASPLTPASPAEPAQSDGVIVKEIEDEVFLLSSRNVAVSSVLIRHRSIESLFENGEHLIKEIIREMSER